MRKPKTPSKKEIPVFNIPFKNFSTDRKILPLLLAQLLLALVFIIEFYSIIEPLIKSREFVFSPVFEHYLMACLAFFGIIAINVFLMKKKPHAYNLQKDAAGGIKNKAKESVKAQKENPYPLAMLLIELFYVVGIAVIIYFYLDPEKSIEWWNAFNLDLAPPLSTILNAIIFVLITLIFLLIHSYASEFDSIKFKGKSAIRKPKRLR